MSEDIVLKLAKDALSTVFMIAGPLLVVSLVVGISVSIAQVVTSIQDMTLSFVPRDHCGFHCVSPHFSLDNEDNALLYYLSVG